VKTTFVDKLSKGYGNLTCISLQPLIHTHFYYHY